MSAWTNYAENALVDWFLRGATAPTLPASWHVALLTAAADAEAGTLTECAGTGYARVAVARSTSAFSATNAAGSTAATSTGTGGRSSNNAVIDFGTAGGADWGTVTHVALFDAGTGGNAWIVQALTTSKAINSGDPVTFPADALGVTLA